MIATCMKTQLFRIIWNSKRLVDADHMAASSMSIEQPCPAMSSNVIQQGQVCTRAEGLRICSRHGVCITQQIAGKFTFDGYYCCKASQSHIITCTTRFLEIVAGDASNLAVLPCLLVTEESGHWLVGTEGW